MIEEALPLPLRGEFIHPLKRLSERHYEHLLVLVGGIVIDDASCPFRRPSVRQGGGCEMGETVSSLRSTPTGSGKTTSAGARQ